MDKIIGVDQGSVSVKAAVVSDGRIVETVYERHHGKPTETLLDILREHEDWIGCSIAFTGSASRASAKAAGIQSVNEVVALAAAVPVFCNEARSVIEMGGQDSKLLFFSYSDNRLTFDDFSMNSVCAAGTGSFLDQQAGRLGLKPEELGKLALKCTNPPRIAGRCSVFAKSDMIHLQQIGTPVADIVAGLCHAVARNFRSSIASGRRFRPPVAFTGGVAANSGMVEAFRNVLGDDGIALIVPGNFRCLTAAGAIIAGIGDSVAVLDENFIERLGKVTASRKDDDALPVLLDFEGDIPRKVNYGTSDESVYIGIDVGSISTNIAAVGADSGVLLASEYLMTAGRPLEAVKTGLAGISKVIGSEREVLGVGTTGSGRYMTADFVGADVVRNEITAQARAAIEIDSEVDTVFEIGGQDSKYISIETGRIIDFEMNKVCAAGTGSFLEEQAEKLDMNIRQFGPDALSAKKPCSLGERCTVFMESDVVAHQAEGASNDNIVAGLSYAIVRNYLNRVVGNRKIGKRIYFQGGTAFNSGVVAAFNSVLDGRRVTVPPNHHITGAIGAAILAREGKPPGKSNFRGFSLSEAEYSQETFICRMCSNDCEVHKVILEDGSELCYGGRCERYESDNKKRSCKMGHDWFNERERLLLGSHRKAPRGERKRIGIPRALWFWELFPFFKTLFRKCGFDTVVSWKTNSTIVHSGVESVAAEACYPVKVAHGHVVDLLKRDLDWIFLPAILKSFSQGDFTESYNCPFVEASPNMIDAGLELSNIEIPGVLTQVLDFSQTEKDWISDLTEMLCEMGISRETAVKACKSAMDAQNAFQKSRKAMGKQAIDSLTEDKPAFVILSRPYNGGDKAVNVDIPGKLASMGATVIPLDCLDLPLEKASRLHHNMYWHYGQQIIAGALAVKEDPRLNAVYITNFGCGPDSFIQHEVEKIMGEKPMLTIEVDEHAADAGIITRCEAFMDSIKGRQSTGTADFDSPLGNVPLSIDDRKVWIPTLGDPARLAVAAVRKYGINAEVFPATTDSAVQLGRKVTTGRECYPAIITTGDMFSILQNNDPAKTAFFMGSASGPCRFGQYCSLQRTILDRAGYTDVPIFTASSSDSYTGVPELSSPLFQIDLLRGLTAGDVLLKALYRLRPYETVKGMTESIYSKALEEVCIAMEKGKSLLPSLKKAAVRFRKIEIDNTRRPLILVFGEIYVRTDQYAHSNTDRRIEELGGEILHTPLIEWFEFVNHSFIEKSRQKSAGKDIFTGILRGKFMSMIKRRYEKPFSGIIGDRPHAAPSEVLDSARPYMEKNIGGEAILSIGAPLALFSSNGIDAAVNISPFTCLPGTVVIAISKRIRKEHSLPWLNLAFDGQEDTDNSIRLEAFMYQVKRNQHNPRNERNRK